MRILQPAMRGRSTIAKSFSLFFLLFLFPLLGNQENLTERYCLTSNPFIKEIHKEVITPYLLPTDHPMFSFLEKLCKNKRITFSDTTFQQAGFILTRSSKKKDANWLVGYHPRQPNWIIKGYADIRPDTPCPHNGDSFDERLIKRVLTAEKMHQIIDKFNLKRIRVPKKWIYPLPILSIPPSKTGTKGFVVVEELIPLSGYRRSCYLFEDEKRWDKEWIKELFTLFRYIAVERLHLHGAIRFDRIGRKLCFFDLEYPSDDLYRCQQKFRSALPKRWQRYWDQLEREKESE